MFINELLSSSHSLKTAEAIGPQEDTLREKTCVRVVSTVAELETLRESWDCLVRKNDLHVPWLSWDWFNLIFRHFLSAYKLHILVLHEGEEIVAIAPFFLKRDIYKGLFKTETLQLMGHLHSPIRSFIFGAITGEAKAAVISRVIQYFCDTYRDWDIIDLVTLPEESNIFNALENTIAASGLKYRSYFCAGNWYLDGIDYSFDEYFESLPSSTRKDILYCQKRLSKMGDFQFIIKSDSESLDDYLDFYDRVREKSWKATEKDRGFNREFAQLAAAKGWLRMGFLFLDGIPIASQKWVVCQGVAYILDVVYDEEYKKYSPGKILSSELSRHVINNDGIHEIDFMRGDEPYKREWTPKRRERRSVTIFNRNAKAHLLAYLMTRILPLIETSPHLSSLRIKLSRYLRKH